jgi:hypothetical protein
MVMHEDIKQYVAKIIPSGSRVICNPAPVDTDEDFVVLIQCREAIDFVEHMQSLGYSQDGCETYDILVELEEQGGWASFKKDTTNYIVTMDEKFFDKWVLATNIAKRLNLLNKEDRVKLFQFILYETVVFYEHREGENHEA